MVILRCLGAGNFFLERVVFPFELLSFDCPVDSEIEIWTHSLGGPEMVESFPSRELAIHEGDSCTPTGYQAARPCHGAVTVVKTFSQL